MGTAESLMDDQKGRDEDEKGAVLEFQLVLVYYRKKGSAEKAALIIYKNKFRL